MAFGKLYDFLDFIHTFFTDDLKLYSGTKFI